MAKQFPNPDGRNAIEFTDEMWEQADRMAKIQCTGEEIAGVLEIDYDTLLKNIKGLGFSSFSEWFRQKSAGGKMSLRRRQFKMSETNVTMQIWLGKQYLGQKDSFDVEHSTKPDKAFDTSKMSKQEYMDFIAKQFDKSSDDKE